MNSLLEHLRQETSDLHNQLHQHPFMLKLVDKKLSLEEYQSMLETFLIPWQYLYQHKNYLKHNDLETEIDSKQKILHQDIDHLKQITAKQKAWLTPLVKQSYLQKLNQEAIEPSVWGLSYTLFGSGLGAKVLKKTITQSLSLAPVNYLSHDKEHVAWRIVSSHLNNINIKDNVSVINSSKQTFQFISDCLHLANIKQTSFN